MKQENKFDLLFDNLKENLSKINNFNLLFEDEKGREVYKLVTHRIAEIQSVKSLILNYYLPAASRSIVDDMRALDKSKYKSIIKITKEEFKENYYETVRLGYVGMFHKFENFIDDLIVKSELLFNEGSDIKLTEFIWKEFSYKIKDWKNFETINRLNWICNCIKHYDSFPKKTPKPDIYNLISEFERIKFTKEDFIRDIDSLIDYYQIILQQVFLFGGYKMLVDSKDLFDDHATERIEFDVKLQSLKEQLGKMISTQT